VTHHHVLASVFLCAIVALQRHSISLSYRLNHTTHGVRDNGAAPVNSYTHKRKGSSHFIIITRIIVLKLINTTCKCDQLSRIEQYLLLVTVDATVVRVTVIQQLIEYLLLIIAKGKLMDVVNSHSTENAVNVMSFEVKLKKRVNK
jgi:hypothetical protein